MASMAEHVRRAQVEGNVYRSTLTNGQEAERARIARELHDDTVQSLVAIAQSIDLTMNWIGKDPTQSISTLKFARTRAIETVDNLRRMIGNLRPPALEELGLVTALKMLAKDVSDISVNIKTEGIERRLAEAQELTLFRSAQEAIRNVQKHSHAERVIVEVQYHPSEVSLSIDDNGNGFPMPEHFECLVKEGHYGLMGIYERVHSLDGTLRLSSTPGRGTQMTIMLPIASTSQPTETERDPVCGALIHPQQAYGSVVHNGQRYHFCCPVCQGAFQRSPDTYLAPTPQLH